ncbi:Hypothetical_protein [Hexamita inflata]|uniref:Hypothetical_protein n=1 Tax=Hexamita inflata TaxID=28002 RepID=A0AA86R1K3_9EUKA|nr:Hypothetical protein HINF_LOCUS51788 [Hexamita inflata]
MKRNQRNANHKIISKKRLHVAMKTIKMAVVDYHRESIEKQNRQISFSVEQLIKSKIHCISHKMKDLDLTLNPIEFQLMQIMKDVQDNNVCQLTNSQTHELLTGCMHQQCSIKVKIAAMEIISQLIMNGNQLQLEDLLIALKIELFNNSRDKRKIKSIFQAIKMKNPVEIIAFLNTQYNDVKSPTQCTTMDEFLAQLQQLFAQHVFLNLKQILNQNIFANTTNFKYLCDLSLEQLQQYVPILEALALFEAFEYYQAVSVPFQIIMQTDYQDISTFKNMDDLLKELAVKVSFNPGELFRNQLNSLSISELFDQQIIMQNRLYQDPELSKMQQQDFVNLQYMSACHQNEIDVFAQACMKYSSFYNNVLVFGNDEQHYVGWQKHWETVIDFVQTHALHDSYQPFDLLCVTGDPKSGKTASMEISAVFMSFFVSMIRPQNQHYLFCQKLTKIIQIDCSQYIAYGLNIKLQIIFNKIRHYIPQTGVQIQQLNDFVAKNDIPGILSVIQIMFENAKCYFVVTWDEVQTLNYVKDPNSGVITNISDGDKFVIGCFYKGVMISLSTPCQHLMSASLSVALLSILETIPVNGKSIMRCQQAIITSFQDSDAALLCVRSLIFRSEEDKRCILLLAKDVLTQNQLPITCASLDQVIKQFTQIEYEEDAIIAEFKCTAASIKIVKQQIAQEWVDQTMKYMNNCNKQIFDFVLGTIRIPGDLLIKLCSRTLLKNGLVQYQLRGQSVLLAMQVAYTNQKLRDNIHITDINCNILQDCGNRVKKITKEQTQSVQALWDQLTEQNKNNKASQQIQLDFFYKAQLAALKYFVECATNTVKQTKQKMLSKNAVDVDFWNQLLQSQTLEVLASQKQVDNWSQKELIFELQEQSSKAWINAKKMLKYFRNTFSHNDINWRIQEMQKLDKVFKGDIFESSYIFIDLISQNMM